MNSVVNVVFGMILVTGMLQETEAISCYVCRTNYDTDCSSENFPLAKHNVTAGFNLCLVSIFRIQFNETKLLHYRFICTREH